jgi:mRNA interferase MazF
VYWADLDPTQGREQAGLRPVLIVSQELFNARSQTVIAMAITSQPPKAGFPLTLALPEGLLPRPSWVKISQVRTLSTERLGKKIASITASDLAQVLEGLWDLIGD